MHTNIHRTVSCRHKGNGDKSSRTVPRKILPYTKLAVASLCMAVNTYNCTYHQLFESHILIIIFMT